MGHISKSRSNRKRDERLSAKPRTASDEPLIWRTQAAPEEAEPAGPTLGFWLVLAIGMPVMMLAFAMVALFRR